MSRNNPTPKRIDCRAAFIIGCTHRLKIGAATKAGKHKTKKDAVTAALSEDIQRRKQVRILEAFRV